ncbi:MAG: hypothetical protein HXX11_04500 [Desulfuromonadales bacterium]|nr:hypothetical protein [Desulfuromonadales bacterium]
MATEANGKVIIRCIPNEEVAQKVFEYVCSNARNTSPEIVAVKLKKLPLVLSSSISPHAGSRVVQTLAEMGAEAAFVAD